MNQRVLATALSVYADLGWAGFSLDLVARRAGVGKAALYLRWSSKETLLHDALQGTILNLPEDLDTGSLRGDLLQLASRWLNGFQNPAGRVAMRLYAETAAHPEVLARSQDELFTRRARVGRNIVRRARERGEIPTGTSSTLVMDLIVGAVMNHVMCTPAALHEQLLEKAESFIEQLVDFVILGIHAAEAARVSRLPPETRPKPPATKAPPARKAPRTRRPPSPRQR